jgi:hypothetical protein
MLIGEIYKTDHPKQEFISVAIYGQLRTAKTVRKHRHDRAAKN